MLAQQVGRVIQQCIQMDEAEQTRAGRIALADALEAFAVQFQDSRLNAEAVLPIYHTVARLRRGEL